MGKYFKMIIVVLLISILITFLILFNKEKSNEKALEFQYNSLNENIKNISNKIKENYEIITNINSNVNTLKQGNIEKVRLLEKWKRQNQKLIELLK